jgi:acetolactate decarboxylase
MKIKQLAFGLLTIGLMSCNPTTKKNTEEAETYSNIKIVGEMKNVMWKGELGSSIDLDTIADKNGLYGLGPVSYLTGELLINNGKSYVSIVTSDTTMTVEKTFKTSAPFFVYGNVTEWNEINLPSDVKTIQDLEKFIDDKTTEFKRPFTFTLIGQVSSAIIHIQNLPEGTKVSSPDEAHKGQTNYNIVNENAEIVGFFSTEHKGVFTHHDSFLHMHLITKDESKMGHLDELEIRQMKLYLPKK